MSFLYSLLSLESVIGNKVLLPILGISGRVGLIPKVALLKSDGKEFCVTCVTPVGVLNNALEVSILEPVAAYRV